MSHFVIISQEATSFFGSDTLRRDYLLARVVLTTALQIILGLY